jgi:hypothetical protein
MPLIKTLLIIALLSSCSTNKMVYIMEKGDQEKSCAQLENTINFIKRKKISRLKTKLGSSRAWNTSMGILALPTGFLSLFLLTSDEEIKGKITDYQKRIEHLKEISNFKSCEEN